jgi:hypothetical protein
MIEPRKYGTFTLDRRFIHNNTGIVLEAFCSLGILVLRVEENMMTDKLTYWAYSESFCEVALGFIIPEYRLVMTVNESSANEYRLDPL